MATGLVHEAAVAATTEWYTPAWIFEALGLDFDLDPCHPEERLPWVPAARVITKSENGLTTPWPAGARVWFNPPYDAPEAPCATRCKKQRCVKRGHCVTEYVPGLIDWMAKMAEHCKAGGSGVGLVFNRSDADWFQEHATTADVMMCLRQRVRFVDRTGQPPKNEKGETSSPGAGSIFLAWGDDCVRAVERCGLGALFVPVGGQNA